MENGTYLLDQLMNKMLYEQATYRQELLGKPPEYILQHANEYNAREDILEAIGQGDLRELEDSHLDVFLGLDKPLETIYERVAPSSQNADFYDAANREMMYFYEDAVEALGVELFTAQMVDCRASIEDSIGSHYDYTKGSLDSGAAVKEVTDKFGPERTAYIVALNIREKESDGRLSRDNKAWAFKEWEKVPGDGPDIRELVIDKVNPGLLDMFANALRRELDKGPQEKSQKPIAQQKQEAQPKGTQSPEDKKEPETRRSREESTTQHMSLNDRLANARQTLGGDLAAKPPRNKDRDR